MSTQTAIAKKTKNPKTNLDFTSIKTGRSTAYGVLSDKKGNTFSIELKGTDKNEIKKFIQYQRKQAKKGRGITIQVEPYTGAIPVSISKAPPKKVRGQARWNGISIKIRELRVKVKRPYKLHLDIDPPLNAGLSHDFPFDNQPVANVKFHVASGSAIFELFEFTNSLKTKSVQVPLKTGDPLFDASNRTSCTISAGQEKVFNCPSGGGTQSWNARVTAGQVGTIFTLGIDLFVT